MDNVARAEDTRLDCTGPEWTSVQRKTLASHKTGVWLTWGINAALSSMCSSPIQPAPNAATLELIFLRDPFKMAVSGMLYHRDGVAERSNDWGNRVAMKDEPHVGAVVRAIERQRLPAPSSPNVTFHAYLKQIGTVSALKAYALDASYIAA